MSSRHYYLRSWIWDTSDSEMPHYRAQTEIIMATKGTTRA